MCCCQYASQKMPNGASAVCTTAFSFEYETICCCPALVVLQLLHWLCCNRPLGCDAATLVVLSVIPAGLLFQSHSVSCVGTSSQQATIITIHTSARLFQLQAALVQVLALVMVLALVQVLALVRILALLRQVAGCSKVQRLHQQLTRPSTVCLIFI